MLHTASGQELVFDRVIMACHSDTTLGALRAGGGMTLEEETILGRVKWNKNEAVLHSDIEVDSIINLASYALGTHASYSLCLKAV